MARESTSATSSGANSGTRPLQYGGAIGNQGVEHSVRKSSNAKKFHSETAQYRHQETYDSRYAYAIANGLSPENAKVWASLKYSNLSDSFWSKVGHFFGGKLDSQKYAEQNEQADTLAFNQLLEAQRQQEYEDPAAQALREHNAGINSDLNGGANIHSGEAGAIEDEALGAGLGDTLSSLNSQNHAQPIFDVCNTLMNGATSVLGLVSAGVGVASNIQSMDQQAITGLFSVAQMLEGLSDNPLGLNLDNYISFDDSGNTQIDWTKLKSDVIPLRSPRYKKVLKHLNDYYSPRMSANKTKADADIISDEARFADAYDSLSKRGLNYQSFSGSSNGYAFLNSIQDSPTYQKYVANVSDLFSKGIEAEAKVNSYKIKYYNALNSGKKAEAENALNDYNKYVSEMQLTAAQSCNKYVQDLITEAQGKGPDSWLATMLLESIISGSFNAFGLGNPYDLPKYSVDKVEGLTDNLFNLIGKRIPTPTKTVRNVKYDMSKPIHQSWSTTRVNGTKILK